MVDKDVDGVLVVFLDMVSYFVVILMLDFLCVLSVDELVDKVLVYWDYDYFICVIDVFEVFEEVFCIVDFCGFGVGVFIVGLVVLVGWV